MLAGIEGHRLKTGKHKVKIKYFPRARIDDMYYYMKPLLWKLPDYIILHIGTKDSFNMHQEKSLKKIIKLKTYIQKELLKYKITISTPVELHDHGKASLTILHLSQKFKDLSISFVYNSSIGAFSLSMVVSISTTKA